MARLQCRPTLALAAATITVAMLLTSSGWAGESEPPQDRAHPELDRMIEDVLGRFLDRMQGALEELPRYALPELTEEGDIIIRRLPRGPRESDNPDEMVDL